QRRIREKAEKLLHLFERLTLIEVTVDLKDGILKEVEFVVQAEHRHDIVGHGANEELFAAVDQALHRLEQQLRRYKQKIQDHRRGHPTGEVAGAPSLDEAGEEELRRPACNPETRHVADVEIRC